ncbi:MAG: hypothetical protein QOD98_2405 [Nocardioidaceae bacterium]|nr:hypothetical protein [Nocardioidaceae bacterium]
MLESFDFELPRVDLPEILLRQEITQSGPR